MPVDARVLNPDRLHLGWQHALLHADPGPPPRRPTPPEQHRVNPRWTEDQRREERRSNRPLEFAGALALGMAAVLGISSWPFGAVPGWGAAVAIGVCLALAGVAAYAVWQGERALRARLAEEQQRLDRLRADRERRLHAAQEDHARRFDAWRARKAAFDAQHEWYAVTLPRDTARIEVAGGTSAGWRALVATLGASCMEGGSEVTVVDLSEEAVAGDLLALTAPRDPRLTVVPEELPRLDVGAGLDVEALADVLAFFVGEADGSRHRHLAADRALLRRILGLVDDRPGDRQRLARLAAALRVVTRGRVERQEEGDPLTDEEVTRLRAAFDSAGPDDSVRERGRAVESQLRSLGELGSGAVTADPRPLRVLVTEPADGAPDSPALGTYLTMALLHEFRRAPRKEAWSRALFVCGAEQLRGDALDRLHDTCAQTGTGLVTMFGSIPPYVKGRLGRWDAAVAFMRPCRADDARTASEHIGGGRMFALNELSRRVSDAMTERAGGIGYPGAQAGRAADGGNSATAARANGPEHDRAGEGVPAGLPAAPSSADAASAESPGAAGAEGQVFTPELVARTSWGRATARAVGNGEPMSPATHRSREFAAEPEELQALPDSVFLLCGDSAGRRAVCGDANPALALLPRATRTELSEVGREAGAGAPPTPGPPASSAAGSASARNGPTGRAVPQPRSAGAVQDGAGTASDGGAGTRNHPRRGHSGPDAEPAVAQPDRDELADLPPNLGPPPERLDWRNRR